MRRIIIIKFLFFTTLLFSQINISYLSNEFGKIEFGVSETLIYIQTNSKTNFSDYQISDSGKDFVIIDVNKENYEEEYRKLQSLYNNVEPVLIYENEYKQICFDEIIVKTKERNDIYDMFKGLDFKVIENEYNIDKLLVQFNNLNTYEVFEIINRFYQDKRVEYIEPNFLRFIKLQTNDPYYSQQWAINNQGYLGGTPDADMDVDEAWNYAIGEGIKVAVLDEGVDLLHPDLQANLLLGFDATDSNSNGHPNVENDDAHGTACAGIIGAVANNDIGIAGIAHNAKIIPVRIAYSNGFPLRNSNRRWISKTTWMSAGINWASSDNYGGADILSNSWGGGSPSTDINTAINNAVNNGRGGKGCIVLFSSGNSNSSSVSYPASLPNVIAVGASSMCDERKSFTSCDGESWGSNYGTNLDVVAPGVKIYTADITGNSGYNKNGDYYDSFNGTSAACPNAAGVVALILSVNPNLTGAQARNILQKTTDKISGYTYNITKSSGTWNNEVGYGRVNALKAVKEAIFYQTTINSTDLICDTNNYTANLQNLPIDYPYTISWSSSFNIQITGSLTNSNVNFTVTPNSGQGWVKATLNGYYEITKDIWIGKPIVTLPSDCYTSQYPSTPNCFSLCRQTQLSLENYVFVAAQGVDDLSMNNPNNWEWQPITNNFNIYPQANSAYIATYFNPQPQHYVAYRVRVQNACGWSDWFEHTLNLIDCGGDTGIGGLRVSNTYKVYPNPSSDIVNVELRDQNNKPEKDAKISGELFDLMGQSRAKVDIKNNMATFSVKGLQRGVYVLNIHINDQIESHQIAVE